METVGGTRFPVLFPKGLLISELGDCTDPLFSDEVTGNVGETYRAPCFED